MKSITEIALINDKQVVITWERGDRIAGPNGYGVFYAIGRGKNGEKFNGYWEERKGLFHQISNITDENYEPSYHDLINEI